MEVFWGVKYELGKLFNTCQAYIRRERGALAELTRLRLGYDTVKEIEDTIDLESQVSQVSKCWNHVWENYPDLLANQSRFVVQGRMTDLETSISDQSQLFNISVTEHYIFVAQFPTPVWSPRCHRKNCDHPPRASGSEFLS